MVAQIDGGSNPNLVSVLKFTSRILLRRLVRHKSGRAVAVGEVKNADVLKGQRLGSITKRLGLRTFRPDVVDELESLRLRQKKTAEESLRLKVRPPGYLPGFHLRKCFGRVALTGGARSSFESKLTFV